MIAGINRQFDIDVFISQEEIINFKKDKLDGPLIWPSYLFCEYIFLRIDEYAVNKGKILEYKNGVYFVNVDNDVCMHVEKNGEETFVYGPHGNGVAIHDVTRMSDEDKMYRHLLNKCMQDIKSGIRPRYDGLDNRKSLNTFLDDYRYAIPKDGSNAGKIFDNIVSLEDSIRERRRINTSWYND